MNTGKKIVGVVAVSLLMGGFTATAASAEPGDVVCSQFNMGIRHLSVTEVGPREFRVVYVDTNTLSGEDNNPGVEDAFARLPLAPVDLRTGKNVLTIGEHATVTDLGVSQSVVTGQAEDPSANPDWEIVEVLNSPAAPWENATLSGKTVTWVQDIDAKSDERGVQVKPSDFAFPGQVTDASAGILSFTVTFPVELTGKVSLVDNISGSFTSSSWTEPRPGTPGVWEADQNVLFNAPGCSVTLAEIGGETDAADAVDVTDGGTDATDADGGVDAADATDTQPDADGPSLDADLPPADADSVSVDADSVAVDGDTADADGSVTPTTPPTKVTVPGPKTLANTGGEGTVLTGALLALTAVGLGTTLLARRRAGGRSAH